MDDNDNNQGKGIKPLLISLYLLLAFVSYFVLFGLSRISRLKELLGL